MTWLDKAERHWGRFAIPNLTFWIMIGQVLFFALGLFTTFPIDALTLEPHAVLGGQVWRLITFLFVPDVREPSIWLIFGWILLFMYGNALEGTWGEFRFNLFIWIGVAATGIAAIAGYLLFDAMYSQQYELPVYELPNAFLLASIFLAFAALNPNFELLVFFILPVKVKWLAWLTWVYFAYIVIAAPLPFKLLVLGATVNLGLFFGKGVFGNIKARQRRVSFEKKRVAEAEEPFHTCAVCGLTDKDDPDMDFVYEDGKGYCRDHVPQ